MRAPGAPGSGGCQGDVLLAVENVSLRFGGVTGASATCRFDIRKGEIRAIIGPERRRQDVDAQRHQRLLPPAGRPHHLQGRDARAHAPVRWRPSGGIARTFQNVALFKGMTTLDNIMAGRTLKMQRGFFWQLLRHGPALREEIEHRRCVEDDHRFPGDRSNPQGAGRQAALRPAEARRARPGARHGAGAAAARRADGGHEPRREGGHVAASSSTSTSSSARPSR